MVKATAKMKDGRTAITIGVSRENLKRLAQDQPIYFDTAQLKIPAGTNIGSIAIFFGETDGDLIKKMEHLIGPNTNVVRIQRGNETPQ